MTLSLSHGRGEAPGYDGTRGEANLTQLERQGIQLLDTSFCCVFYTVATHFSSMAIGVGSASMAMVVRQGLGSTSLKYSA